jgi:hypothetical protein
LPLSGCREKPTGPRFKSWPGRFMLKMGNIKQFFKEFYIFLKENKWWWIVPLIIFCILLGLLIYLNTRPPEYPVFVYNIPMQ